MAAGKGAHGVEAGVLLHVFATATDEAASRGAFEALLDVLVRVFDKLWVESSAGYMDFPFGALVSAYQLAVHALAHHSPHFLLAHSNCRGQGARHGRADATATLNASAFSTSAQWRARNTTMACRTKAFITTGAAQKIKIVHPVCIYKNGVTCASWS